MKNLQSQAKDLVSHCMERNEAFALFAEYPEKDVDDWADVFGPLGVLYTQICELFEEFKAE
jgi:hypothetical protein